MSFMVLMTWAFVSGALFSIVLANPASVTPEFGVVIDAGSSGSRVHVYQWPRRSHDHDVPAVEEIYNHKVRPGVSAFVDRSGEEVRQYILGLVANAAEQVPSSRQADTAIYFMATAGMRLLAEEEADHLMTEVDAVLGDVTVCPFRYHHINTRILSGEEEGVFAWIALNYLRGFFTDESVDDVGVLELGGASTQIAFVPSGSLLAGKFPVFLGGQEYAVYVHSYLTYGSSLALRHTLNELSEGTTGSDDEPGEVLQNPCMPLGDSALEMTRDGSDVTVIGTSDPQGCMDLIGELVYDVDDDRCHPKPCAIGPFYQPSVPDDMDFFAVASFVYTPLDLDEFRNGTLLENGHILRPEALLNVTWEWCTKSMSELEAIMGRSSRFFRKRCNLGLYTYKLFTDAYGFEVDTDKIKIADIVNGEPIAWPLGALLFETQNTPVPGL